MRYLANKEERTEYRKTHNTYFKCFILGYELSNEKEVWGYVLSDDLKQAKKLFNKEVDEQLETLDYGYMAIGKYEKQNDKWVLVSKLVNDFGVWKTEQEFLGEQL